ncbi:MAG: ATP-dependent helicase [Chloroflexi bacterium]|nr:ATP-dependent helicase [Chloroflexota bacterium]
MAELLLTSKQRILEGLTFEQAAAVTHGEGPLLIVAGAGTGKTRVLTHRIAYLITEKLARPSEILALTFTEKAAQEVEERVDLLVPYGYVEMWISTFHAFGDRILRDYALEIGLAPDFRVLPASEQAVFLRQHLFDLPLEHYRPLYDPTQHLRSLVALFSRAKDEAVSPDKYLEYARRKMREAQSDAEKEEAQSQLELAGAYDAYRQLMWKHGFIDYGDQVFLVLDLFRSHPAVLEKFRQKFKYILVDEFQDTNSAQFELLKVMCGENPNLTVVGDDDQSIYRFRGAAISNILNFIKTYPGAKQVVLTRNFRSYQCILDHSRSLILHNNPERLEVRNDIDKNLTADKVFVAYVVKHITFETASDEADILSETIREKVENEGRKYSDFAILLRRNRDADTFIRAMNLAGIPYRFTGSQGLYERQEVKQLLSFLRSLTDPGDSTSLYFLASCEPYNISHKDLVRMNARASRENISLMSVMEQEKEKPENFRDDRTAGMVGRLLKDMDTFAQVIPTMPPGRLLYRFITETGYLKKLSMADTTEAEARIRNISRFFQIVEQYEAIAPPLELTASHLVRHIDLLLEAGDDPAAVEAEDAGDAVNILTVHKAKGLEFPVVFLCGLEAQRFPTVHRADPLELPGELAGEFLPSGDFHLAEERRLCYVGMTRAKDELFMTWTKDRGGKRTNKPSLFILEAFNLSSLPASSVRKSPVESLERFAPLPEGGPSEMLPVPDDRVLEISHMQVDDYLTCPLKYKYVHMLRVPILRHHQIVYGNALHEAVSDYHRRKAEGLPVTLNDLIARYEASWSAEGFISRAHEEQRMEEGRQALKRFFEEQEKSGVIPDMVEKEFSFRLENNVVRGRWDRVDKRDDGAVIIDYKSSDIKSQESADRRAKESLQLGIYVLGYHKIFGRMPAGAELRFLGSDITGLHVFKEKDLVKIEEKILGAASGIRRREFPPKPAFRACSYCAYRDICLAGEA